MEDMQTEKFVKRFMIVAVAIMALICLFLSRYEMRLEEIDVDEITVLSDETVTNVDNAYYDCNGKRLIINGWCIIKGKETNPVTMHVILKESDGNIFWKLPTAIVTRTDVTECVNDGINYDNSGYSVNADCRELDFSRNQYEILVLYESGDDKFLIPLNRVVERKE